VRPGPGTARRLSGYGSAHARAYRKASVETFILSRMPLLEEAYRFDEKVLLRLDVTREVSKARNYTWSTLFDRGLSTVKSA
jgi:alkanesulfonate monooxygenase